MNNIPIIEAHKDKLAYWAAWKQGLINRTTYINKIKEISGNDNITTSADAGKAKKA